MAKKSYSIGEIDYSKNKPKLIKQDWFVREDLNETIAIFLRDSLKEFLKSDITVHIPNSVAYENDIKVQSGEMTEEERRAVEDKYNNEWNKKVLAVIELFDEYATIYNKLEVSSRYEGLDLFDKHNELAKQGFDKLKEIFAELIL